MTPEQKKLFEELKKKLTPLEVEVVINMVAGMNPTDAVRASSSRAKSSIYVMACTIANKPEVKEFMEALQLHRFEAAVMTQNQALEILTQLSQVSLNDLIEWGEYEVGRNQNGEPVMQACWNLKDSAKLAPQLLAAVQELSVGKEGIKIKLHDRKVAIKQLAEMLGWEAPKKVMQMEAKSLDDFYNDEAASDT
tara:strand:- start:1027 stop:1605 length:579 start_codon:yes stop_codon:yes gene_type:complete